MSADPAPTTEQATASSTTTAPGGEVTSSLTTATLPAKTPDVTPAQVAAGLKFVVMVALALGLHINRADQVTIIGASGLLCAMIVLGDALIRRGRASALALLASAQVQQALDAKPKT